MDSVEQLAGAPAILELGDQKFVILPPRPRDKLIVGTRMREMARAKCCSPLDYVLKHTSLPTAALALAISEAIKLGSGGGVDPSPDAVWEQYDTLEGVRFQLWHYVSRAHKEFTPEQAAKLVTEDNLYDVAEKLNKALQLAAIDPNAVAPATGSSS
jgi:hypothetical protein